MCELEALNAIIQASLNRDSTTITYKTSSFTFAS